LFRRQNIDENSTPGMRYLYWGLTGARFGPSSKGKDIIEEKQPNTGSRLAWAGGSTEPVSNTEPQATSAHERIARLIAERDSARYERELEIDYRETLLRDLEMLRVQLDEAQRRIMELEKAAQPAQTSQGEVLLEQELVEARKRISELEALVARQEQPSAPAAQHSAGQDEMMDIFLQFLGSQENRDDAQL